MATDVDYTSNDTQDASKHLEITLAMNDGDQITNIYKMLKSQDMRIKQLEAEKHNWDENNKPASGEEKRSDSEALNILKELEEGGVHGMASINGSRRGLFRTLWILLVVFLFTLTVSHTWITIDRAMESPIENSIAYTDVWSVPHLEFMICDPVTGFVNITSNIANANSDYPNGTDVGGESETSIDGSDLTTDELIILYMNAGWVGLLAHLQAFSPTLLHNIRPHVIQQIYDIIPNFIHKHILSVGDVFHSCVIRTRSEVYQDVPCDQFFTPIITSQYGVAFASNISQYRNVIERTMRTTLLSYDEHITISIKSNWNAGIYPLPGQGPLLFVPDTEQLKLAQVGIELPLSTSMLMYVSARKTTRLQTREHPCLNDQDIRRKTIPMVKYTDEQCTWYHRCLHFERVSNCSLFQIELYGRDYVRALRGWNTTVRPSNETVTCTELDDLFYGKGSKMVIADNELCGAPCTTYNYEIRHTELKPKTDSGSTRIIIRLKEEQVPVYTETYSLQWYDYMSLIGGSWGLWLGFSVMTILHVVGKTCSSLMYSAKRCFSFQHNGSNDLVANDLDLSVAGDSV